MAEDGNQNDPDESEPNREPTSNDDDDDMFLFVLANAIVPIFFRRRG